MTSVCRQNLQPLNPFSAFYNSVAFSRHLSAGEGQSCESRTDQFGAGHQKGSVLLQTISNFWAKLGRGADETSCCKLWPKTSDLELPWTLGKFWIWVLQLMLDSCGNTVGTDSPDASAGPFMGIVVGKFSILLNLIKVGSMFQWVLPVSEMVHWSLLFTLIFQVLCRVL